jgi:hypothetical protein
MVNYAGRLPESDRSSVRNRVPIKAYNDVPDVPFVAGRKRMLPEGVSWPPATYTWWRALRVMPHCVLWTDTDWQYAVTTAWIHARVWVGDYKLAGELRQRERAMGCTDEARRGLRIRYVAVEPAPLAAVTTLHTEQGEQPAPASMATRRVQAFDPNLIGR